MIQLIFIWLLLSFEMLLCVLAKGVILLNFLTAPESRSVDFNVLRMGFVCIKMFIIYGKTQYYAFTDYNSRMISNSCTGTFWDYNPFLFLRHATDRNPRGEHWRSTDESRRLIVSDRLFVLQLCHP